MILGQLLLGLITGSLLRWLRRFVDRIALLYEPIVLVADWQPHFESRAFTRIAHDKYFAFVASDNSVGR